MPRSRGVNKEERLLITGVAVVAVAYFGLLKPITNFLGLTKSADDKKADEEKDKINKDTTTASTAPPNNNPWTSGYLLQFWSPQKNAYTKQVKIIMDRSIVEARVKRMEEAIGVLFFNTSAILAIIKLHNYKTSFSQFIYHYQRLTGKDLLNELKTKHPTTALPVALEYVKNLPSGIMS